MPQQVQMAYGGAYEHTGCKDYLCFEVLLTLSCSTPPRTGFCPEPRTLKLETLKLKSWKLQGQGRGWQYVDMYGSCVQGHAHSALVSVELGDCG